MMRITTLSIVLLAALPVLPTLAQDNNCYKPDIGREEMVNCLEAKHERRKKEIVALRDDLERGILGLRTEVTKTDTELRAEMKQDISTVHTKLKQDISAVRTGMDKKNTELYAKLKETNDKLDTALITLEVMKKQLKKQSDITEGKRAIPQEDWQSPKLTEGWVVWNNSPNTYNIPGYYKDSLGLVHLRGAVKTSLASPSSFIFYLPPGYRPGRREAFIVPSDRRELGRIDIASGGEVIYMGGNKTWLSLDGITFRATTWHKYK